MTVVRWTAKADRDLDAAGAYIADDSAEAAARVLTEILEAVERLEVHPRRGREGRVPRTRELVIAGTSYVVAYAVADRDVHILAVRHGAQEWPAILEGFGVTYGS